MKCIFSIIGEARGGDEYDIKAWLENAILEYNIDTKVVDKFNVLVQETD